MHRISRSHIECDQECRFKRYMMFHADGRGYMPTNSASALTFGSMAHELLQNILEQGNEHETIVKRYKEQTSEDDEVYVGLIEALVLAWKRIRLPQLMESYSIEDVEREYNFQLAPDIQLMTRIDAVLRNRSTDELYPLEFKTTSIATASYLEAYHYDTQTMLHTIATEARYKKPCSTVLMEHLYKGRKYNGQFTSSLIRGFYNFDTQETSYSYKKNWQPFYLTSDLADLYIGNELPQWMSPLEYWISTLPYSELRKHLLNNEVQHNQLALEEWTRATVFRERQIMACLQDNSISISETFPKRMNRFCYSDRYSRKCPFFSICFEGCKQPEELGLIERIPHHEQEFSDENNDVVQLT